MVRSIHQSLWLFDAIANSIGDVAVVTSHLDHVSFLIHAITEHQSLGYFRILHPKSATSIAGMGRDFDSIIIDESWGWDPKYSWYQSDVLPRLKTLGKVFYWMG